MIDKENEDTASKLSSVHGEVVDTVPIEENTNVEIHKIQSEQDELPNYLAQWKKTV